MQNLSNEWVYCYRFEYPYFLIDYISEHSEQLKFIIIDYGLPQMMGCELANQINEINPNIKMVFVTGFEQIINNTLNLSLKSLYLLVNL